MKLYLIIKWFYEMPLSQYEVWGIYRDKAKAEKALEKFTKENDNPVEEDDYGPMSGTKFTLWERDTED